ncbi:hypothetical protein I302_101605 [Kwoniella bestiolae CBS 10118]|uniref:Cytoplasmic protein n=1 Tax=Kwoniella bestiolae CBS 10118 TaxID=1296100 RepID=A0A1B9GCR7_9TREE|nr:cytoplasmic protein [Kwoniella bestiolae CBS 10118]OCF28797.1 cytoplasmic protein [Kwoniella bestiolae CBS 10118]
MSHNNNNNNNNTSLLSILTSLFKICCGSTSEPSAPQQQQGYPGQQQQQQYHPGYSQQQQAYPPQSQPSWANVAGHQQNQQGYQGYHQNQQQPYHPQQQQQYPPIQQPQPHHQQQYHANNQQQQHWQSNGAGISKPHSPPGGVVGPHHPAQNQDQINATNARYTDLRDRARREGDEAHRCFAESQSAYQSGDGARAHELSQQGKSHQRKQDELDDEASAWIFTENNKSSPPDTIDLHGLYVKEAIERVESAITTSQRGGSEELRVIVGKGIHSQGGRAKIKPAVEGLMVKYNLTAHVDPSNTGVLIVDLQGRTGGQRSRDAGGLVDELDKGDEGCKIM